jgi:hypothetical protein
MLFALLLIVIHSIILKKKEGNIERVNLPASVVLRASIKAETGSFSSRNCTTVNIAVLDSMGDIPRCAV